MATEPTSLSRQPTVLDYSSPTQFKFNIHQLPKVEFFTTAANIPDISLGELVIPTPFKSIPILGDQLTFGNLIVSFIVDEELQNYQQIHNWLIGIGFPKSKQQFVDFRARGSNLPGVGEGGNKDIGDVGSAVADRHFFSDATLTILSNKNNPLVEVRFSDLFPVALSGLDYNQNVTDVEYLTATIDFRYKLYEIIPLNT
jgi:hypothetical protein|tara:strand:- start:278 stop:874 length:597 start_codon:yes stop_codon:yes gene_type:complete